MSKHIAFLLTGLVVMSTSIGCCCLGHGGGGYGCGRPVMPYSGASYGGGCGPCNGGCPVGGGGGYYQGAMTQSFDTSQAAFSSMATQTVAVPPGAIQGPPIMATVPGSSLPPY